MMTCLNSECVSNCDFERVAFYARKRHVEGIDTTTLMTQARNEMERRAVAHAALLDLDDDCVRELRLFACEDSQCKASSYREQLQIMIADLQARAAGF